MQFNLIVRLNNNLLCPVCCKPSESLKFVYQQCELNCTTIHYTESNIFFCLKSCQMFAHLWIIVYLALFSKYAECQGTFNFPDNPVPTPPDSSEDLPELEGMPMPFFAVKFLSNTENVIRSTSCNSSYSSSYKRNNVAYISNSINKYCHTSWSNLHLCSYQFMQYNRHR